MEELFCKRKKWKGEEEGGVETFFYTMVGPGGEWSEVGRGEGGGETVIGGSTRNWQEESNYREGGRRKSKLMSGHPFFRVQMFKFRQGGMKNLDSSFCSRSAKKLQVRGRRCFQVL